MVPHVLEPDQSQASSEEILLCFLSHHSIAEGNRSLFGKLWSCLGAERESCAFEMAPSKPDPLAFSDAPRGWG